MPPHRGTDGLNAGLRIRERQPHLPIIVLSQYSADAYALQWLTAPGNQQRPAGLGYLLKERIGEVGDFMHATHTVAAGGIVIDPDVVQSILKPGAQQAGTSNPRMGGDIWTGEDEAAKIVWQTIESADATGQLRGILDVVRSNRVEDDFSERWSFAREDFERKMHKKRSKTRVRFVELTDTIPVQGPESEVLGAMVTNEFLTALDTKNRQTAVLLNSGVTKKIEIAKLLGYANHSPVPKRLRQIQKAAAEYFAD